MNSKQTIIRCEIRKNNCSKDNFEINYNKSNKCDEVLCGSIRRQFCGDIWLLCEPSILVHCDDPVFRICPPNDMICDDSCIIYAS